MRSSWFVAAAACGGLMACTQGDAGEFHGVAHAGDDVVENALTTCGVGTTVPGVDVSYYQQNINWNAVAGAGYKFGIARFSDGYFHDPKFQQNWDGIKAAGMIRGVYQWFEPNQDPLRQANELIAAVGVLQAGDLPVMADVEEPGPNVPSPSVYAARLMTWANRIREGTGRDPMIYTGHYYWPQYLGGTTAFSHMPLVHAQYTSAACPNITDAWTNWTIWQWSSTASVPGIPGNVDVNRFNGTEAQLHVLAGGGIDPLCAANANYGGCNGTVLTRCDNGQVASGDCGAFGAGCSVEGGAPHCVHPYCIIHGAGENATWCTGNVIKQCAVGQYTEGDCGAYGATCSEAGGTAHCVHPGCAAHGETSTWCEGSVIKTCVAGVFSEGDCGFYGAACSELGGAAHCVHPYCAGHGENSAWCEGSVVKTCVAGVYSEGDCGFYGAACSDMGGAGHCVHPYCILHGAGENAGWCDGSVAKQCTGGGYVETDCAPAGQACNTNGATASCSTPVVDAGPPPDAAVTVADAGTTVAQDAGTTVTHDAGTNVTHDAGSTNRPDAAVVTSGDAGQAGSGEDAGSASSSGDGATVGSDDTTPTRPFGCSSAGVEAPAWLVVAGAWMVVRRKRAA